MTDRYDYDGTAVIIANLVRMFERFENDYGLSISIHTTNMYINIFNPILQKYNNHDVPYCILIKSDYTLMRKCVNCQRMVTASFAKPRTDSIKLPNTGYFGMCCFGVEEFVLPIITDGVPVGFISVTGYSQNLEITRQKALKQFDRTGIYPEGYEEALKQLSGSLPDSKLLTDLLTPAADLLGLICMRTKKNMKQSDYGLMLILSYIDTHYMESLTVPLIAKALHCSESYVNHLFKKRSGKSISCHINDVRVSHAKDLLRTTNKSIKDIAIGVGFNDTNYFSSIFKAFSGSTPSKYRDIYKKRS